MEQSHLPKKSLQSQIAQAVDAVVNSAKKGNEWSNYSEYYHSVRYAHNFLSDFKTALQNLPDQTPEFKALVADIGKNKQGYKIIEDKLHDYFMYRDAEISEENWDTMTFNAQIQSFHQRFQGIIYDLMEQYAINALKYKEELQPDHKFLGLDLNRPEDLKLLMSEIIYTDIDKANIKDQIRLIEARQAASDKKGASVGKVVTISKTDIRRKIGAKIMNNIFDSVIAANDQSSNDDYRETIIYRTSSNEIGNEARLSQETLMFNLPSEAEESSMYQSLLELGLRETKVNHLADAYLTMLEQELQQELKQEISVKKEKSGFDAVWQWLVEMKKMIFNFMSRSSDKGAKKSDAMPTSMKVAGIMDGENSLQESPSALKDRIKSFDPLIKYKKAIFNDKKNIKVEEEQAAKFIQNFESKMQEKVDDWSKHIAENLTSERNNRNTLNPNSLEYQKAFLGQLINRMQEEDIVIQICADQNNPASPFSKKLGDPLQKAIEERRQDYVSGLTMKLEKIEKLNQIDASVNYLPDAKVSYFQTIYSKMAATSTEDWHKEIKEIYKQQSIDALWKVPESKNNQPSTSKKIAESAKSSPASHAVAMKNNRRGFKQETRPRPGGKNGSYVGKAG